MTHNEAHKRTPAPIGAGGPNPPPVKGEGGGGYEVGGRTGEQYKYIGMTHPHELELRMLGQIEKPTSKRARRPTRGTEEVDNSFEATRESNMICPITCECQVMASADALVTQSWPWRMPL